MTRYLYSRFTPEYFWWRIYLLLVAACLTLACLGQMPSCSAGWVLPLPQPIYAPFKKKLTKGERRRRERLKQRKEQRSTVYETAANHHAALTWQVPLLRTLFLAGGFLMTTPKWFYLSGVPYLLWLLQLLSIRYSWLGEQPEWRAVKKIGRFIEQGLMLAITFFFLWQGASEVFTIDFSNPVFLSLGIVTRSYDGSTVSLQTTVDDKGNTRYHAYLSGDFELSVSAQDPFRRRFLILFLRLLEVADHKRGGRPTRDGRTPFVTATVLAEAYSVQNSKISRWQRYWLDGDWRRLLSIRATDILTLELQDQIVSTFAKYPWWGIQKVHQHLNQEGIKVSHRQVRQAAEDSGFLTLRTEQRIRYVISAESFRPRDELLVQQLLQTNKKLIEHLDSSNSFPQQIELELSDLSQLATELAIGAAPSPRALPFMLRVQQLLFGNWEMITDEAVCCIYCGSCKVCRKSRKPRIKKYRDDLDQIQKIEVY